MDIKALQACHSSRVLDGPCYSSQAWNGPCYSPQTNQVYSSALPLYVIQKRAGKSIFGCEGTSIQTRKEKSAPSHGRERERKSKRASTRTRGRQRDSPSAPLFICFFLPPGLPCANWAQSGVLFYLKSSLRSSDLPLTFLCSLFMGFSLAGLLSTAILDSFSLF